MKILNLAEVELNRMPTMLDLVPKGMYDQCLADGYGWAPVQHSYYHAVSKILNPGTILEIGVLDGFSLCALGLGCPSAYMEGWDNESYRDGSLQDAGQNLIRCGLHNFGLIKVDSQSRTAVIGDFDLAHVDGDHTRAGARHDLELVLPAARNILIDDYDSHPEVRLAVDDFLIEHQDRILNVVKM